MRGILSDKYFNHMLLGTTMRKKELFINAIRMIDVDGNVNIPTVLYYEPGQSVLIGSEASAKAISTHEILNANFKIDLGLIDPKSTTPRRKFPTVAGTSESAARLTTDFLHQLLLRTREWFENSDIAAPAHILLAEPLAMQIEKASIPAEWLANYRKSLTAILSGEGFKDIDFLPEPFAVFQYYRYGLRHPLVAEQTKQRVLVIDFGGGTFDVCIIETTKEGDISQSGRNSRPLAATSAPVGGFFFNRMITGELLNKYLPSKGGKLKTGWDVYKKWQQDQDLSTTAEEYRNFVRNVNEIIYGQVENLKLTLCKHITNWSLEAPLDHSIHIVPITVPEDPFSRESRTVSVRFSAVELRKVFLDKVWNPHLKPVIRRTLQRAKEELSGAPLSIVLLSGGSANVGWLRELLKRDFSGELNDIEILRLPDFQEVVAKGLAVECARRFYNQEGDFSSVTYNRLCLILDADKRGPSLRPFSPKEKDLPNAKDTPGVLLPSASVLKNFIDRPMLWQFRLDHPPRQQLDYYFLRSSFTPDDIDNLQNVEEHTAYTPRKCSFDSSLQIKLQVSQDGTARPRFIYKSGPTEETTTAVNGRPFYLDMTYGHVISSAKAYIGLDFGTSNTSVSFVDEPSIQVHQKRSSERQWRDLNELTASLPYPLADPLARYLQSETSRLGESAREFIEAALTLAAYITYLEYCTHKNLRETKLFKGFTQRSAGPLWDFLQKSLEQVGKQVSISLPYQELLTPEFFAPVDSAVTFVAQHKHGKAHEANFDTLRPVQILANISQKVFSKHVFGFFEQVSKQKFVKEYQGLFRIACGFPPFLNSLEYQGANAFSPEEPFVLDTETGVALSLSPLLFWNRCGKHPDVDAGHCYLFDKEEKQEGHFSFKAVGYPCVCDVSVTNGEYQPLATELLKYKEKDPKIEPRKTGALKKLPEE